MLAVSKPLQARFCTWLQARNGWTRRDQGSARTLLRPLHHEAVPAAQRPSTTSAVGPPSRNRSFLEQMRPPRPAVAFGHWADWDT
jgi:anti-sigma factor RsiW